MSASKIRADHDALKQIAQSFASNAQTIEQTTQSLKSNLDPLRSGDWVGKGADKFYAEMDSSVLPTYKRLSKSLNTASTVTKKISQIMQQAEDDAAALFKGGHDDGDGHDHDHDEGDSTREKGGDGGFPTGAVIGGLVGGALGGLVGAAAGAWIGNKIENAISDSQARSEADKARREAVSKLVQKDDRQGAINEAIKQYNIDTSGFKEVRYDPDQNPNLDAKVKDGVMTIGPGAFRSPGYLASTIGHEAVHTQQEKGGRLINTPQGIQMNEVEAYDWEIKNADANGLDSIEKRTINRRRESHYNKLSPENQKRVDNGNYVPA